VTFVAPLGAASIEASRLQLFGLAAPLVVFTVAG
jgi:hypothetical protein